MKIYFLLINDTIKMPPKKVPIKKKATKVPVEELTKRQLKDIVPAVTKYVRPQDIKNKILEEVVPMYTDIFEEKIIDEDKLAEIITSRFINKFGVTFEEFLSKNGDKILGYYDPDPIWYYDDIYDEIRDVIDVIAPKFEDNLDFDYDDQIEAVFDIIIWMGMEDLKLKNKKLVDDYISEYVEKNRKGKIHIDFRRPRTKLIVDDINNKLERESIVGYYYNNHGFALVPEKDAEKSLEKLKKLFKEASERLSNISYASDDDYDSDADYDSDDD